jgi:hypothetical protein
MVICFGSFRTTCVTGGKITTIDWATHILTVACDGACSPNVSLRMAWISFGALLAGKTWWQLASRCCWNRAHRLTCFRSTIVTRKVLQFGTNRFLIPRILSITSYKFGK